LREWRTEVVDAVAGGKRAALAILRLRRRPMPDMSIRGFAGTINCPNPSGLLGAADQLRRADYARI